MGKNWKGGRGGGGGGGGGAGTNDLTSCRGLGIVIGTCDAARERETSKELVNLFNEIVEDIRKEKPKILYSADISALSSPSSIQSMLLQELSEIRTQSNNLTQNVMSVNTGIKGVVCIKFLNNISPCEAVKRVFESILSTESACTRHVVRIIPLETVFFPDTNELKLHLSRFSPNGYSSRIVIEPIKTVNNVNDEDHRGGPTSPDQESCCGPGSLNQLVDFHVIELKRKLPEISSGDDATCDNPLKTFRTDYSLSLSTEVVECAVSSELPMNAADKPPTNLDHSGISSSTAVKGIVYSSTNPVQEPVGLSSTSTSTRPHSPYSYTVLFKARNHNVLHKHHALATVADHVPVHARSTYNTKCKDVYIIEALKNICGLSVIPGADYEKYMEFHLRNFQAKYATKGLPQARISSATVTERGNKKISESKVRDEIKLGDGLTDTASGEKIENIRISHFRDDGNVDDESKMHDIEQDDQEEDDRTFI